MEEKKLTGYPSIDKPWLKYYKEGAEEAALNIPTNKTVWDVIEEKLIEYKDIPAIEYFGRVISRPEFIDMVYTWARALKALGVKENEVVPYYGPFFPDVCAMTFALNMIGACAYFLKLAISPEALAEETAECKFAIVFEDMWQNVSGEFSKDRFEKVIIISAADGMSGAKKQVVSLLSKLKSKTGKSLKDDKYLSVKQAKNLAKDYHGEVKVPYVQNRSAFITSSSGTTIDGVVKGCVATNESTLAQLYMGNNSNIQYFPGDRCLTNFPPTASTALNCLFMLPLYQGMVVVIDPRVSENDFYNQVTKLKPNVVITTCSMWETFFNMVIEEINKNIMFDFSFAKEWVMGGEGTIPEKLSQWNQTLKKCNASTQIFSASGLSELFAVGTADTISKYGNDDNNRIVISNGIPYAGISYGIFDENGKEMPYNHRGELWYKTISAMKEYYRKPELTRKVLVDGWLHTGDLAEIDENGFLYLWGRMKDYVEDNQGNSFYLFDIANQIKEKSYIDDAIVLPMATEDETISLVAHIVWSGNPTVVEQKQYIEDLNASMKEYLPESFSMVAYSVHDIMLPYSPTTLKKDKNRLSKQTDGYIQVIEGEICEIVFDSINKGTYDIIIQE